MIVPQVELVIEVARGDFAKRDAHGRREFLSPLPCPFNYGAVPTLLGGDGEPFDAIVLGPRLAVGTRVTCPVQAAIGFIDAGDHDAKLICADSPLTTGQRAAVWLFFHLYARIKRIANRFKRQPGITRCVGWIEVSRVLAAARAVTEH